MKIPVHGGSWGTENLTIIKGQSYHLFAPGWARVSANGGERLRAQGGYFYVGARLVRGMPP